jgi:glycosyltransferase involved in cell wall biosynthesis
MASSTAKAKEDRVGRICTRFCTKDCRGEARAERTDLLWIRGAGGIISLDAVIAPMISIFILTKNEERNIADCIEAVRWSDDIHVLDSYSTDATVEIAQQLGAKVSLREFDNYSGQQNWALRNIPFKYPWVFHCDADERVTPGLAKAMERAVENPGDTAAFQVQRRDFFLGKWLKHVQVTSFYLRLFRPERMRYERVVHQVSIVDGPVSRVNGYLDHFPFSKGVADWIAKHNSYSTMEAEMLADRALAGGTGSAGWSVRKAIFAKDFVERRRNQKELFYRLPCRPFIKFLALFFLKRGFLDGRAGLTYSILISFYEYMIMLKTQELGAGRTEHPVLCGRRDAASPPSPLKRR